MMNKVKTERLIFKDFKICPDILHVDAGAADDAEVIEIARRRDKNIDPTTSKSKYIFCTTKISKCITL